MKRSRFLSALGLLASFAAATENQAPASMSFDPGLFPFN
jgi:hypothetical protein